MFDGFLVMDEKPINGIENFVPGIFNGSCAPPLTKWSRTSSNTKLALYILCEGRRIRNRFWAAVRIRLLYEPFGMHEDLSAV
jgi:hypothetical protein